MRYLKEVIFVLILGIFSINLVFSQAALTIASASGVVGTSVSVPVQASGITDMAGFQFTISYDRNKLNYLNCSDWAIGIKPSSVQVVSLPSEGKITFIYNDVTVNINSGTFFKLNFEVRDTAGQAVSLVWCDDPTSRELINSVPKIFSGNYTNGKVTISGIPAIRQIVYIKSLSAGLPVSDTEVSLTGYGTKNSDTSGIAEFMNVLPESNIAYTISKNGFYIYNGNLDVNDSVVFVNAILIPSTEQLFNVSFLIKYEGLPVSGASVSLTGYGNTTSNDSGIATFTDIFSGNIGYTINTPGYLPLTGSITVADTDLTEQLDLILKAPSILEIGKDSALSNHSVTIPVNAFNISAMTGFQFTISYDNTKLEFINCSDWGGGTNAAAVQITNIPTEGKITFVYNDAAINFSSGTFFNLNFNIIIDSSSLALLTWSDAPTQRELSNSLPEEIKCNYSDGCIQIVSMPVPSYSVILNVKSGDNIITGASVELSGYGTKVTDETGSAIFNQVFPSEYIAFSVSNPGYAIVHDSITVINTDVIKNIKLIPLTGSSLSIGKTELLKGDSIALPVNAENITDMTGFQFTILYDKTKMAFTGCSNWMGGTNAVEVQVQDFQSIGQITFVYNDAPISILSGLFFNLNFRVNRDSADTITILWSDLPTQRELSNSIPEIITCSFYNGILTIPQPAVPTVETVLPSAVFSNTGMSGGNIISDGGSQITQKGVCWSTTANPTNSDSLTNDGGGIENFISYLSGLIPATSYHVRAYAINASGIGYGEDLSFSTSPLNISKAEVLKFNLYPNPVNKCLNIVAKSAGTDHLAISIYDNLGNEIFTGNNIPVINGKSVQINFENFTDGIYLIRLTSEGKNEIHKIIVKN